MLEKKDILEIIVRLHRLEDELVGAQVVTDKTTIDNMVNRIEHARQEVLAIIKDFLK